MSAVAVVLPGRLPLSFTLDAEREAHEPPEARGIHRDQVALIVSDGVAEPALSRFDLLPSWLRRGDLLVVNTSATIPAALDASGLGGERLVIHLSTEVPGGLWLVEPRRMVDGGATVPLPLPVGSSTVTLDGGVALDLLRRSPGSDRLWLAAPPDDVDLLALASRRGRPIRYRYVHRDWPIATYRSVFGRYPGSAEMPSASRPFTPDVVAALVARGVGFAAVTLHTGVSSLEGHELPYPERYRVDPATAAVVNATRSVGGRVIAVGTTVVRALETTVDAGGAVHPGKGWTDVVVTPERGVRTVDGLVTGWHEPEATHLAMLEAIAGRSVLVAAYEAAHAAGLRWHEFGDSHLILRGDDGSGRPRPDPAGARIGALR